jgi:hypothetical protein
MYFTCIATGFMLIEVGLVQKFGLLLGNPGYAIAVVLAAVILGTGSGSLASDKLFFRKTLSFRRVCVLIPLLTIGLLSVMDAAIHYLLAFPWLLKAAVVTSLLFFIGFFLGQLFPQGLKRVESDSPQFVPWAWAINGAASTVAAGIGVILSRTFGFNAIIICGAFCYLLVVLIPRFR